MRTAWGFGVLVGFLSLGGSWLEAANAPLPDAPRPQGVGPDALQLGSILSAVPERCAVRYAVRVVASTGGGEDAFSLEVWDEGRPVRVVGLAVPADGNTHELSGRVDLPPVSERNPGVALLLKDGASVLDVMDPVLAPCVAADVPTVNTGGLVALGLLLGGLGVFWLTRKRSAATEAR